MAGGNLGTPSSKPPGLSNIFDSSRLPSTTQRTGNAPPPPSPPPSSWRTPVMRSAPITRPAQSPQPANGSQSAQVVPPAQVARPAQDSQGAQVSQPVWASQPVQASQPAQNLRPVQATQPAQSSQPAQVTQPSQVSQPAQVTRPPLASQPEQATRPIVGRVLPINRGSWGSMAKTAPIASRERDYDQPPLQHQTTPPRDAANFDNLARPTANTGLGNGDKTMHTPSNLSDNTLYPPRHLSENTSHPPRSLSDNTLYPPRPPGNYSGLNSISSNPQTDETAPKSDTGGSWGSLSRKMAPKTTGNEDFWSVVDENIDGNSGSKPEVRADETSKTIPPVQSLSQAQTIPEREVPSSEGLSPEVPSPEVPTPESPSPEVPSSAQESERDSTRQNQTSEEEPEESFSVSISRGKDRGREVQDPFEDKKGRKDRGKPKKSGRGSRYEDEDEAYERDDAYERYEERRRLKAERKARKEAERTGPIPIHLPELISIASLAEGLKVKPNVFLEQLGELGFEGVTLDSLMAGETAALVAQEYGFEPIVDIGAARDLKPAPPPENPSLLPPRPPVVTIMGHVDHGKTTLLDYLRQSSVAAQEHGGITQHIGAFSVSLSTGKVITFLDTPGHAAFLTMRERGAQVTDIVVLVVAADDSVMPQTIEALKHARSHRVPIIVAISKIDREGAQIDHVKADLAKQGVEIEDFGGDVQVVLVSAKTGQGMSDLEENILTLSEILDMRAETDVPAEGWVLESSLKLVGKSATVLVKRGTLRPGDYIAAGLTWAKVRNMRNEAGVEVSEALPGTPVEILGWKELPAAGDQVLQGEDEDRVKNAVEYRENLREQEKDAADHEAIAEARRQHQEKRAREKEAVESTGLQAPVGGNWNSRKAQQYLQARQQAGEAIAAALAKDAAAEQGGAVGGPKVVNFLVRADVHGSVEAVSSAIQEIGNHEVRPRVLRGAAGPPTEFDVEHAAAANSALVCFSVAPPAHVRRMAEEQGVQILEHNVIYHLVDDIKETLNKFLAPEITYKVLGEAEVLQIFPINIRGRKYKNIAGCRVRNGSVTRGTPYRVFRNGEVIFDGALETLKHLKKDVTEMHKGGECGIGFEEFQDLQVGDKIQSYEEIRTNRKLQ